MRVDIDQSCTGCGMCVSAYPEVFAMGDCCVTVIVDDIPPELEIDIQQLADDCPLEAIRID